MANFVGQTLNIPGIGNATVTSIGQYTNTPGFDIFTDKGNFIYYDSSYVNKGVVKDGKQYITPELLGYVQNKEASKVDFSSYGDVPKSTKGGLTVDGNGYLFTNPSAFDVFPTYFQLGNGLKELTGISADSNGNLSYKGGNGDYSTYMYKGDDGAWLVHTDTKNSGGGGGLFGGIGGFIGSALNSVSDFLGTSGGGGGILGGLASIDPGPKLGDAAATLDKAVTDNVPGGWATVAAVAATIASAGTASPLLAAEAAGEAAAVGLGEAAAIGAGEAAAIGAGEAGAIGLGEAGAIGAGEAAAIGAGEAGAGAIASEAGQAAFFDALASGATSAEAIDAGLVAQAAGAGSGAIGAGEVAAIDSTAGGTGLTGGAGGSTGLLTGGSTAGLTIPTEAAIAVDPAIASASGAGIGGTSAAAGGGLSAVGEISAGLPAAGSTGGAGTGLSAELAPNTIIGTGANGGAIGGTYLAGADGMVATDLLGNAIPASSVGMGGIESATGFSAADVLSNANRAKNIAKLLMGSNTSQKATKLMSQMPTAQQYSQFASLNQPLQQQFGGYYQMNKNPFTFSNPMANALKNKDITGFDVSGTGGQALNTTNQVANLLRTLA